jgi:hypothetical protein
MDLVRLIVNGHNRFLFHAHGRHLQERSGG